MPPGCVHRERAAQSRTSSATGSRASSRRRRRRRRRRRPLAGEQVAPGAVGQLQRGVAPAARRAEADRQPGRRPRPRRRGRTRPRGRRPSRSPRPARTRRTSSGLVAPGAQRPRDRPAAWPRRTRRPAGTSPRVELGQQPRAAARSRPDGGCPGRPARSPRARCPGRRPARRASSAAAASATASSTSRTARSGRRTRRSRAVRRRVVVGGVDQRVQLALELLVRVGPRRRRAGLARRLLDVGVRPLAATAATRRPGSATPGAPAAGRPAGAASSSQRTSARPLARAARPARPAGRARPRCAWCRASTASSSTRG